MPAVSFRRRSSVIESLEKRLLLSGTLDPGFGAGGIATATFGGPGGTQFNIYATAVQSDGKVVEAGVDSHNFCVLFRFQIDGTPDPAFGHGGLVEFNFYAGNSDQVATALAIQANGDIVVAGDSQVYSGDPSVDVLVARFSPAGVRDNSFVNHQNDGFRASPSAILIQNGTDNDVTNDYFVIVGTRTAYTTDQNNDIFVTRLDNSGTAVGVAESQPFEDFDLGDNARALGATLDLSSGPRFQDVVIVGSYGNRTLTTSKFSIVRLRAGDLTLDPTFSGDGKLVVPFVTEDKFSYATAALVQSDGKIVVGGVYGLSNKSPTGVGVMRLNADGSGDKSFGVSNGQYAATFTNPSISSNIGKVAIIPSQTGDLLVGAEALDGVHVLCLTRNGKLDTVFNNSGSALVYGAIIDGSFSMCPAPGGKFVIGGGDLLLAERFYDRALATIYIDSLDPYASETGPDPASFRIVQLETRPVGTRVYFTPSGTANAPGGIAKFVDYSGISTSFLSWYVDVPAGSITSTVTITPKDDAFAESDETATFTIVPHPEFYDLYSPSLASTTLTIFDNDGQRVSGSVYQELNNNTVRDPGEPGLAGVQVYLDANNNRKFDAGELSTTTNASGNYTFFSVPVGSYMLRQTPPTGQTQTSPTANGGYAISVIAKLNVTGKQFGDKAGAAPPPASLSGITFSDVNKNGIFDAGDVKLSGKTIFLDTNNNGKLDAGEKSVLSDANGKWSFTGLSAGTYHIRRIFATGFTYSTPLLDISVTAGMNKVGLLIGVKPI
jgi:uncharacterized delta-60 repeat protein